LILHSCQDVIDAAADMSQTSSNAHKYVSLTEQVTVASLFEPSRYTDNDGDVIDDQTYIPLPPLYLACCEVALEKSRTILHVLRVDHHSTINCMLGEYHDVP
jgi:hypothetical protein